MSWRQLGRLAAGTRMGLAVALLAVFAMLGGCAGGSGGSGQLVSQYLDSPAPVSGDANNDTDNDGVADAADECPASPEGVAVDAFGCSVPLYVRVTVSHADGAPEASFSRQLAKIAQLLRRNPDSTLRIEGHCAPQQSPAAEQARSLEWAQGAREVLLRSHGIPPERVEALGVGATRPLVSNDTLAGRQRNQRLELTLQGHYSAVSREPLLAAAGQEPLNRERMRPKRPEESLLARPLHLRFAYGGVDLVPQDNELLQALGDYLRLHPDANVQLVGHTDSKGSQGFNLKLSRERAAQVKSMLVQRYAIAPQRIATQGRGEAEPIADNESETGRLANRRVSVTLTRGAANQPSPTQARQTPLPAPAKAAPLDPDKQYLVKVSIKQCKLWLFEKGPQGEPTLVRSYDVATPKPGTAGPEGLGHVTRIDFNPWWVPTANLKRAALNKGRRLPNRVRPGSSANPMGKFKIHLSHGEALRIHGTNQPGLIGRRVSAGCIRMQNKDGLEMAKAIQEGTEVLVVE